MSNLVLLKSPESTWCPRFCEQFKSFCCCSIVQLCPTPCDPMDCSMAGFPVLHHLTEVSQTHVHWVSDATQPSSPLSSPFPPVFYLSQHQGLFQGEKLAPNFKELASAGTCIASNEVFGLWGPKRQAQFEEPSHFLPSLSGGVSSENSHSPSDLAVTKQDTNCLLFAQRQEEYWSFSMGTVVKSGEASSCIATCSPPGDKVTPERGIKVTRWHMR